MFERLEVKKPLKVHSVRDVNDGWRLLSVKDDKMFSPEWIKRYKLPWYRRLLQRITGAPFLAKVVVSVDVAKDGGTSVSAQIKDGRVYIIDVKHSNK